MAILPDRTELTTPADGDLYVTTDVSDTTDAATGTDKKITWANIKTALTTVFDSLYATTAQGALADSAQQPPAEGAFVDGDKTKLDGIETGADVTDATNVTAAGALMDSEVTNLAQVKAFDSSDYATAAQGTTADSALQPTGVGSALTLARVAGSTYSTIQHLQDAFHSSGVTSGGGITDDADGTITVAAGTGLIRATDSPVAEILFMDWAAEAGANVALTDNDMNYVYVEYNAGAPRIMATTTKRTDYQTNVLLGTVYREGTTLYITDDTSIDVGDHAAKMILRMNETMPFQRVSGGILSETGTRNIAVTAGDWWEGLTNFTTTAIDTSVTGSFTYYYSDGAGGFTTVATQTQIDNTQYDDGSGTLATLSNAKYGTHWVYLGADNNYYVLYGTINGSLTEANDAGIPASVPPHFAEAHARLIGKIVILKSASVFTSVQSSFNGQFSLESVAEHNTLAGLQGGTTAEYYHMTAAQNTVIGNTSGTNTGDEASASTTVEGIVELATDAEFTTGTDETRYVNAKQVASVAQTMTNKRVTKRVGTTTSSATPTINTDNYDMYTLTAQAADITSFTTNLSGTPTDGQTLIIRIKGTAARAITWGASFAASTVALPTTTVSTDMLTVGFIYDSASSKWVCSASA